jgi:hypothetical protein
MLVMKCISMFLQLSFRFQTTTVVKLVQRRHEQRQQQVHQSRGLHAGAEATSASGENVTISFTVVLSFGFFHFNVLLSHFCSTKDRGSKHQKCKTIRMVTDNRKKEVQAFQRIEVQAGLFLAFHFLTSGTFITHRFIVCFYDCVEGVASQEGKMAAAEVAAAVQAASGAAAEAQDEAVTEKH